MIDPNPGPLKGKAHKSAFERGSSVADIEGDAPIVTSAHRRCKSQWAAGYPELADTSYHRDNPYRIKKSWISDPFNIVSDSKHFFYRVHNYQKVSDRIYKFEQNFRDIKKSPHYTPCES